VFPQDPEVEQHELEVRRLSEGEIEKKLDECVVAHQLWQHAQGQLRVFEEKHKKSALSRQHSFPGITSFHHYNRRKREYLEAHKDLIKSEDETRERYERAAEVVRVLLPANSILIHNCEGKPYRIKNTKGGLDIEAQG
jgi:uncharacterized protein YjhX (UPF0386 family)